MLSQIIRQGEQTGYHLPTSGSCCRYRSVPIVLVALTFNLACLLASAGNTIGDCDRFGQASRVKVFNHPRNKCILTADRSYHYYLIVQGSIRLTS